MTTPDERSLREEIAEERAAIREHGTPSQPNYARDFHPGSGPAKGDKDPLLGDQRLAQSAYQGWGNHVVTTKPGIPDSAWGDVNKTLLWDKYLDNLESVTEGVDIGDRLRVTIRDGDGYSVLEGTVVGMGGKYRAPDLLHLQVGSTVYRVDVASIVKAAPQMTPMRASTFPVWLLPTSTVRGRKGSNPNWGRVDPREAKSVGLNIPGARGALREHGDKTKSDYWKYHPDTARGQNQIAAQQIPAERVKSEHIAPPPGQEHAGHPTPRDYAPHAPNGAPLQPMGPLRVQQMRNQGWAFDPATGEFRKGGQRFRNP